MKYKVLKRCFAGGRINNEGDVVELPETKNKYLQLIVEKKGAKKAEPKKDVQTLASLGQKPPKLKTGMAAEKKEEVKKEGK